jgi:hypothetical protein
MEERKAIVRQHKEKVSPLDQFQPEVHRPAFQPKKPVPTVQVPRQSHDCYFFAQFANLLLFLSLIS